MIKIYTSLLALVCVANVSAQINVNPNVGNGNVTQNQNYNPSVTMGPIISPTAGVYIRLPQWGASAVNLAQDINTENMNNKKANNPTEKLKEEPVVTPNSLVKDVVINKNENSEVAPLIKEQQKVIVAEKKIGQVPPKVTYSNIQLQDWNKTTINDFEKEGKERLEKSYLNFLSK